MIYGGTKGGKLFSFFLFLFSKTIKGGHTFQISMHGLSSISVKSFGKNNKDWVNKRKQEEIITT